ncbi:hypothetical protein ATANTOWER_003432 [Ataeniobius toweri]|uniref:Uncharacterized protein n=1 Tax=Ataeniobius toweri TaxID=208326 RepID=A0ABU7BDT4_9TELE|nr:hypothetical protein [Ataeniobius toweri]
MQTEPILQNGWSIKQRRVLLCLRFSFPRAGFFVKMNIADCFTCLCSVQSFAGAGNYRAADSKQSSVKCGKSLEKKLPLFTVDQQNQSHMKSEQSKNEDHYDLSVNSSAEMKLFTQL